jgi:heme a synthase
MESSSQVTSASKSSRWPFRAAFSVAFTMFFLIWIGGLVTTQDAGMAVPDWPGTYGYNMFAYPLATWFYGPVDLFIEHGHRLWASFVGLLAIASFIIAWRSDSRAWVVRCTFLLLLAVIFQGVLGGVRVLLDGRTYAMIHGCFGPLCFGFASAIALFTARSWQKPPSERIANGRWIPWLLLAQSILIVLQLFVGAQLRHTQAMTAPSAFMGLVHIHLTLAFLVAGLILTTSHFCFWRLSKFRSQQSRLIGRFSIFLFVLILVQLCLGFATWICNYALPWADVSPTLANYTIATKGYWESWITTVHQATGSLLIAFSFVLTLAVWRQKGHESLV